MLPIGQCNNPPPISKLKLNSSEINPSYGVLDEALYVCDAGFTPLNGTGVVFCQGDYTWTVPTLVCIGE